MSVSDYDSPMSGSAGGGQGQRVKGVSVVKPIVYGSISRHFGKKRESDGHTHEWTVYVKPFRNEDMSAYVRKVQFKLHESYANPNRIVSKPPYEVSETGWGEFEVQIKIHLADPQERPVTLYHVLKLFHTPGGSTSTSAGAAGAAAGAAAEAVPGDGSTTTSAVVQGRKTVVSECYDEIVFQEPTQYIHALLTTTRPMTLNAYKHETDFEDRKRRTEGALNSGRAKVREEIADFRQKLMLANVTIDRFRLELGRAKEARAFE